MNIVLTKLNSNNHYYWSYNQSYYSSKFYKNLPFEIEISPYNISKIEVYNFTNNIETVNNGYKFYTKDYYYLDIHKKNENSYEIDYMDDSSRDYIIYESKISLENLTSFINFCKSLNCEIFNINTYIKISQIKDLQWLSD